MAIDTKMPAASARAARFAWYALHLRSRQEPVVAERLRTIGVEYYLPIWRSLRQWKDRKVWLDLPLFPGYLFVRLRWLEKKKVVYLPGVISLLGTETSYIDDRAIDQIKTASALGLASPSADLTAGNKVRVVRGPFKGMAGILLRKEQDSRLVVHLDGVHLPFILHVPIEDLRPV